MPAAARKIALTDRSLQALRPALDGRTVVWDALLPGLAVRVGRKGKRAFYAVKRRAGQAQVSWVMLGQGQHLPRRPAARDHHLVGDRCLAGKIDRDDVLGLAVLQRLQNELE